MAGRACNRFQIRDPVWEVCFDRDDRRDRHPHRPCRRLIAVGRGRACESWSPIGGGGGDMERIE